MQINMKNLKLTLSDEYSPLLYAENGQGLSLTLNTEITDKNFIYNVNIKNKTEEDITPNAVVLRLGIDSYMATYPEWHDILPSIRGCLSEKDCAIRTIVP